MDVALSRQQTGAGGANAGGKAAAASLPHWKNLFFAGKCTHSVRCWMEPMQALAGRAVRPCGQYSTQHAHRPTAELHALHAPTCSRRPHRKHHVFTLTNAGIVMMMMMMVMMMTMIMVMMMIMLSCASDPGQAIQKEDWNKAMVSSTWSLAPIGSFPTSFRQSDAMAAGKLPIVVGSEPTLRLSRPGGKVRATVEHGAIRACFDELAVQSERWHHGLDVGVVRASTVHGT